MIEPVAGDRGIGRDQQVGIDEGERAGGAEIDRAAIDAHADGELVAVVEQFRVAGRLQRAAEGGRVGLRAVDRAVGRHSALIARSRRAGNRLVVGPENLEVGLGRHRRRKTVIVEAKRVEQRVGRVAAAALHIRVVAVDMLLAELAGIDVALHRPGIGDGELAVEREQAHLVPGGLRPGVDRAVVAIEQLHRRRPDHAEGVAGGGGDQMDFRPLALPAEIGIDAGKLGRRLEAPAVVAQPLRREVEREIALLHAVLHSAAGAAEGAALQLGFEALVGEAVLHADIDGAAERVEAEHRVARPDVGAVDGIGRG